VFVIFWSLVVILTVCAAFIGAGFAINAAHNGIGSYRERQKQAVIERNEECLARGGFPDHYGRRGRRFVCVMP
jgi:hypothetical protein